MSRFTISLHGFGNDEKNLFGMLDRDRFVFVEDEFHICGNKVISSADVIVSRNFDSRIWNNLKFIGSARAIGLPFMGKPIQNLTLKKLKINTPRMIASLVTTNNQYGNAATLMYLGNKIGIDNENREFIFKSNFAARGVNQFKVKLKDIGRLNDAYAQRIIEDPFSVKLYSEALPKGSVHHHDFLSKATEPAIDVGSENNVQPEVSEESAKIERYRKIWDQTSINDITQWHLSENLDDVYHKDYDPIAEIFRKEYRMVLFYDDKDPVVIKRERNDEKCDWQFNEEDEDVTSAFKYNSCPSEVQNIIDKFTKYMREERIPFLSIDLYLICKRYNEPGFMDLEGESIIEAGVFEFQMEMGYSRHTTLNGLVSKMNKSMFRLIENVLLEERKNGF